MKYQKLVLLCLALLPVSSVGARPHTKRIQLKKNSGIYGQVLRIGFAPIDPKEDPDAIPIGARIPIINCVVVVMRARDRREVHRVTSNKKGTFKVTLKPGKYLVATVTPKDNGWTSGWPPGEMNAPTSITVWRGFYSKAETVFDAGW